MTINVEREMNITPADWVPGPGQGHWTYNHYAALPEDGKRYEIVDGVLYMSPSPNNFHQKVSIWLSHYLVIHVMVAGLGEVRAAPFDVELAPDIVVQPDVVVVLNANLAKMTRSHIVGAPDLVAEILSPGTAKYDRRIKQAIYARSGISEYWIVDPVKYTIEVLFLQSEAYRSLGVFSGQDVLVSKVVPTIAEVHVEQFFI
jgi:Uma2 family endonuclease